VKILRLDIKNFKRDSQITIIPSEHVVSVGGKNRAGKSSALDGIVAAICGKKAVPGVPLKKGETEGWVRLELDGDDDMHQDKLVVERLFTADGKQKLRLLSSDGFEAPEPQTLLNTLYGQIGFDPLHFTRLSPKDQANTLRELVGIDFTELDDERETVYRERTQSGRLGQLQKAKVEGMPFHADAPTEEVSVAELVRQQTELEQQAKADEKLCKQLAQKAQALNELTNRAANLDEEIARLQRQLEETQAQIATVSAERDELDKQVREIKPVDTAEIKAQIVAADETNRKVQANHRRAAEQAELDRMRAEYKSMSDRIDEIDAQKQEMLAQANWPVAGLGFDSEGVTLNGLPFSQASSAEQLQVSVAMGMKMNPKLRVLIIRDGSLLDDDTLAAISKQVQEADYQLWVEVVTRTEADEKRCSVVIEDGKVKAKQPALIE
jgi:DNA repair exonuclease SbcCD ATPase subunit